MRTGIALLALTALALASSAAEVELSDTLVTATEATSSDAQVSTLKDLENFAAIAEAEPGQSASPNDDEAGTPGNRHRRHRQWDNEHDLPPRHHHHAGPPGVISWIAEVLGFPPPPAPHCHHRHRHYHHHQTSQHSDHHEEEEEHGPQHHPRPQSDSAEKEGPPGHGPHRHHRHLNGSPDGADGDIDEEEALDTHRLSAERLSSSRPFRHRPHSRHESHGRRPHCLKGRFKHFVSSGAYLAEGIAMSFSFLVISALVKLAFASFVILKLTQKIKKRIESRREGGVRLEEAQVVAEKTVLPLYVEEQKV